MLYQHRWPNELSRLGIALLPPSMAGLDMQAGLLVPVLPQYQRRGNGLNVLYPRVVGSFRARCRHSSG